MSIDLAIFRRDLQDDVLDPQDQAALQGLHRVLRPGAHFVSVAWGEQRRFGDPVPGILLDATQRYLWD